ncbi:thioredoxin domain-containing protein [Flavobacteriaceae bacterium]|nr:thioredoxin domain-containing protein [Flavobacteriaceae bacterium]MDA9025796.1 thioredoxin domain-containing protein [bacterium]MDB9913771.1 thioredoxin domain-containing protein [Flavobacteriaceae bacterium]
MRSLVFLSFIATLFFSCNSSTKETLKNSHQYTNSLINETSPYLLQHAHNPVNWKAWNTETLQEAKDEKKLMIISVGYSACHWCHVMEKESFEDSTVAAVMNKNFISVKVDREERPDVDQIYINAVQLMTGSAGWPLNVITLPDGRPVWGGTYFTKKAWLNSLEKMQKLYDKNPQNLIDYASKLEEGIKSMDLIEVNTNELNFIDFPIETTIKNWSTTFDNKYGGANRAPKFMMPNNLNYLLRYGIKNKDKQVLDYVYLTLDNIAYGGVYDHIGGGFSRYSTDMKWHVPHFEKMLYDNAQLVSLYSQAYKATKNPLYEEVVKETLEYIKKEMTHQDGAFYSSLDADSVSEDGELEEGAYYVFNKEELKLQLKEDFSLFSEYYNITNYGKWEKGNYVLIRKKSDQEIIDEFSISQEELNQKKKNWKQLLLAYRNNRAKPRLDDKSLTSWNALMIKGYVDAYKAFQVPEYLNAAQTNAQFLIDHQLQENGALNHSYKDGKSTINGYLEDYAAAIDAFIALYEVTLNEFWINKANELAAYTFENFFDAEKNMFYFTSKEDEKLVARNFEYRDNVIPASNSMMAKNLLILSHHFDNKKYLSTASKMLHNVQPEIESYPSGFSNWLDLMANFQDNFYEVVVVGKDASKKIAELNARYLPNILIAGSTSESKKPLLNYRYIDGETLIYVCVNNSCKLPVSDISEALNFIK